MHILIRALFCTFNFTLPACRPNFADAARSTSNVGQASITVSLKHSYASLWIANEITIAKYSSWTAKPLKVKYIQSVPGGKVNILRDHSIGLSKQKCLYEHVSYSERFPR